MKKAILIFIFLSSFSFIQAQKNTKAFEGELNKQKVVFYLDWHSDENISGSFYYPETLKRYVIKGFFDKKHLILTQYHNNEEVAEIDLLSKKKNGEDFFKGTYFDLKDETKQVVWLEKKK